VYPRPYVRRIVTASGRRRVRRRVRRRIIALVSVATARCIAAAGILSRWASPFAVSAISASLLLVVDITIASCLSVRWASSVVTVSGPWSAADLIASGVSITATGSAVSLTIISAFGIAGALIVRRMLGIAVSGGRLVLVSAVLIFLVVQTEPRAPSSGLVVTIITVALDLTVVLAALIGHFERVGFDEIQE